MLSVLIDFLTGGDPTVQSGASANVIALAHFLSMIRDLILTMMGV